MVEEQTRTMAPSLGTSVHSTIVAHYINGYGTEEQKRRWLPKMASGELVGAVAMTEPGTGSDLQSVKTKAIRQGDEYVIDGSKTFITNGLLANLVIVVAKTDPENAGKGISLVVVETDGLEGFSRGRVLKKIGQHGQDTAELFFDGVRVPTGNLLGTEEGQGFIQLMQQLPQERLVIAVAAVAAIEEALAHTLKYTKERQAFGKPVFNFQNTQVQAGRDGDDGEDRAGVPRRLHRQAPRAASWTCRPPRWRSGGRRRCSATSPTSACSSSAATATCRSTRSRGCTPTRGSRRSTAGRTRS